MNLTVHNSLSWRHWLPLYWVKSREIQLMDGDCCSRIPWMRLYRMCEIVQETTSCFLRSPPWCISCVCARSYARADDGLLRKPQKKKQPRCGQKIMLFVNIIVIDEPSVCYLVGRMEVLRTNIKLSGKTVLRGFNWTRTKCESQALPMSRTPR